jgi:hypothetical protein
LKRKIKRIAIRAGLKEKRNLMKLIETKPSKDVVNRMERHFFLLFQGFSGKIGPALFFFSEKTEFLELKKKWFNPYSSPFSTKEEKSRFQ